MTDKKFAAMITVSPQMVDDSKFDLPGYIAQRLSTDLVRHAAKFDLELQLDGFKIERVEGGYWHDDPQPWWRRLFGLKPTYTWVPTVAFRAEATAKETE